jgi:DNA-binding transcriptional LysR family regulator
MLNMKDIHIEALRRLDLNLLPVLEALLTTRSVTRTAARLHMSQSAVSHCLARLRRALPDPLFVRGVRGLEPTAWCLALAPTLRHLLGDLAEALTPPAAWEPATAQRTFTLAMTDYVALLLLPPLLEHVRQHAPGVDLVLRQVHQDQPEIQGLESGSVDVALILRPPESPGLRLQRLFEDRFVCLVRRDHPLVGRRLTLERYLELSHLLISPQGHGLGFVDSVLAQRGLSRRIALRLPYFIVAAPILARTDLLLTLPERVAREVGERFPLRQLAPPLPLATFAMHQLWHERNHHDPAHRWLRERIFMLMQERS